MPCSKLPACSRLLSAYFTCLPCLCLGQFYLPEKPCVTKDFLRDVFAEKKQLFKKDDMRYISVPAYDELSVRRLWPQLKKDPEFAKYFPDKFPKEKGPPRTYFFDILNTLQPDYLAKLMAHANEQRMAADAEGNQHQAIQISQYWAEELKAMPFLSSKLSRSFSFYISFFLVQKRLARRSSCSKPVPRHPRPARSGER